MDKQNLFELLGRIAEGIVAVIGPHCEVVIHDFSDLEHSLVLIAGNLTGRRAGAPIPDLSFIPDGGKMPADDMLNYKGRIGTRHVQYSTIWIRDAAGTTIGSLGINVDFSGLERARELLEILSTSTQAVVVQDLEEDLPKDLHELIDITVQRIRTEQQPPDLESLGYDEKMRIVQALDEEGLFLLRGAVGKVATLLGISRATVCNYRSQ